MEIASVSEDVKRYMDCYERAIDQVYEFFKQSKRPIGFFEFYDWWNSLTEDNQYEFIYQVNPNWLVWQ